jgi:hypothetical protein
VDTRARILNILIRLVRNWGFGASARALVGVRLVIEPSSTSGSASVSPRPCGCWPGLRSRTRRLLPRRLRRGLEPRRQLDLRRRHANATLAWLISLGRQSRPSGCREIAIAVGGQLADGCLSGARLECRQSDWTWGAHLLVMSTASGSSWYAEMP